MAHEQGAVAPLGILWGRPGDDGSRLIESVDAGMTAARCELRDRDNVLKIDNLSAVAACKGWQSGAIPKLVGENMKWEILRDGELLTLIVAFEPALYQRQPKEVAPSEKSRTEHRREFDAFARGVLREIEGLDAPGSVKIVGRCLVESMHFNPGHPDHGRSWRTKKGIASKTGLDRKTVRQATRILEIEGLVRITPPAVRGGRTYYDPIWKAAARAAVETAAPPAELDEFEDEVDEIDDEAVEHAASEPETAPAPPLPDHMAAALASGAAVSLRPSPDAVRAGASPLTALSPEAAQAERQRRAFDYGENIRWGYSPTDAEALARNPMTAEQKREEVMRRLNTQHGNNFTADYDPYSRSAEPLCGGPLPLLKGEKW